MILIKNLKCSEKVEKVEKRSGDLTYNMENGCRKNRMTPNKVRIF